MNEARRKLHHLKIEISAKQTELRELTQFTKLLKEIKNQLKGENNVNN